jgi:hypothetical protein
MEDLDLGDKGDYCASRVGERGEGIVTIGQLLLWVAMKRGGRRGRRG